MREICSRILTFGILVLYMFFENGQAYSGIYPALKEFLLGTGEDAGEALFLTPLIEAGKIDEARKNATVHHKQLGDVTSYSGFITVDKKYNSNLFFWYFPAANNPKNAPVILWLQGGPGYTSIFGIFFEHGPFVMTKNKTLTLRKYSWHGDHHLIYIDNPVGSGYSFTDHDEGYCRNNKHTGRKLHTALIQFFQVFKELQGNDFFVGGESYAGKYVTSLSYTIHQMNPTSKVKINLKGLAIGSGIVDPINQISYGDYLFQHGFLDSNGRDLFHQYEKECADLIKQDKHREAFELYCRLVYGKTDGTQTLFNNLTRFDSYTNYLKPKEDQNTDWMSEFIQMAEVRRAIHVGNYSFELRTQRVEEHLMGDITRSEAKTLAKLSEHYKIFIWSGQLDIIAAYPMTESYLEKLELPGLMKYKNAVRVAWLVDDEIAGYAKTVGNLSHILVRNAGHLVPKEQPKWAFNLISRLTFRKYF